MDDQTNRDANQGSDDQPTGSTTNVSQSPGLESIRKEALAALAPLIDEMDAVPERKFEIIMTAIRVNFDETLLKKALETAKSIKDTSVKVEALIDIVNEANFKESES